MASSLEDMPDFIAERADEHGRAFDVVMETNEPIRISESVMVLRRRAEEAPAESVPHTD